MARFDVGPARGRMLVVSRLRGWHARLRHQFRLSVFRRLGQLDKLFVKDFDDASVLRKLDEEAPSVKRIKARIGGLDAQKKTILTGSFETGGAKDRMVRPRQTVKKQHAHKCR